MAAASPDFRLSPQGIHLLRNRFNYATIPFDQIQEIKLERTKVLNNWLLILLAGVASILFGIYYTYILWHVFSEAFVGKIYIEEILLPVLPYFFGLFMVVQSLKNEDMLIVKYQNKKKKLLLEDPQQYQELQKYIKEMFLAEVRL